jgi:ATP-dependent DNA helicase RecQ
MIEKSEAPNERKRLERQKLELLLGYCETTNCRRQSLLHYFGEQYHAECKNCDNCIEPPQTWDGTVAAQKALSCIYRTGQRFGAVHLIDVLLGKPTERVRQFGHDRLGVFGVGREHSEGQWRIIYRQLVAMGLAVVDLDGFGGLSLHPASRAVLRDKQRVTLRKEQTKVKKSREARVAERSVERAKKSGASITPADEPLWQALRDARTKIAREQGVPPYVIFHDATLLEILRLRPHNEAEMANVSGVGAAKLTRYGQTFLAVIAEHG